MMTLYDAPSRGVKFSDSCMTYSTPFPPAQGMSFETIRFQPYDIPYFPYFFMSFGTHSCCLSPHYLLLVFTYHMTSVHSFARSTKDKMLNKGPQENIHEQ